MRTEKNITKEHVGLAGEYAVASELCKRGFYAQLTLGNHKKTDLLVETDERLFRVSVKSKTKSEWPAVKGIWAEGDLLVFVDFTKISNDERPCFYVLTVSDWINVIKKIAKEKPGAKVDKNTNTVYWEPWSKTSPNGWKGCSIRPKYIEKFKDNWPTS